MSRASRPSLRCGDSDLVCREPEQLPEETVLNGVPQHGTRSGELAACESKVKHWAPRLKYTSWEGFGLLAILSEWM